jgi:hypothetical protein
MQEVPLALYGPGWVRSQGLVDLPREVTVADIAPTLAELMDTPFPARRPGHILHEALLPEGRRPGPPPVVVVVVWDGGGSNVLQYWPNAWPFLAELIDGGTGLEDAVVGSSPSLTPPVHATIGTGAFPEAHGIVDIPQRVGGTIADSYANLTPSNLLVTALAEIHDEHHGNAAEIAMFGERGWLLGMIGHGAYRAEGDRDVAVLVSGGTVTSNEQWYRLPDYLDDLPTNEREIEATDALDGEQDGTWMGHSLASVQGTIYSPVWLLYQNRIVRALLEGEGFGRDAIPDMLFLNYKAIDHVGHRFNMVNPEMEATIRVADRALQELTQILDEEVGAGRWVLAFTADHGQAPDPVTVDAWPIGLPEIRRDVARHFGVEASALIDESRPLGLWLDRSEMRRNDITEEAVSRFLLNYRLGDNLPGSIPPNYAGRKEEQLFEAVFPSRRIGEIWDCARVEKAGTD